MCIFEAEIGDNADEIMLKSLCYAEDKCLKTADLLNKLKDTGIQIKILTACPLYHDVKPFMRD